MWSGMNVLHVFAQHTTCFVMVKSNSHRRFPPPAAMTYRPSSRSPHPSDVHTSSSAATEHPGVRVPAVTWLFAHNPPPTSSQWCSAFAYGIACLFSAHSPHMWGKFAVFPYRHPVAWQQDAACTMKSVSLTSSSKMWHGGVAQVEHCSMSVGRTEGMKIGAGGGEGVPLSITTTTPESSYAAFARRAVSAAAAASGEPGTGNGVVSELEVESEDEFASPSPGSSNEFASNASLVNCNASPSESVVDSGADCEVDLVDCASSGDSSSDSSEWCVSWSNAPSIALITPSTVFVVAT
mmetsp:Transcript_9694/g.35987  ORF Transcript_9694/g.35987 Transcript_9694/m.35987 type:complete len:294 (+) Transcript_9694:331-1212(+)